MQVAALFAVLLAEKAGQGGVEGGAVLQAVQAAGQGVALCLGLTCCKAGEKNMAAGLRLLLLMAGLAVAVVAVVVVVYFS